MILVLGVCSVFILPSCSKENQVPQPPHLKAQLVTELFSALRQSNYEVALNRIDRLRELNPDDIALQSIQINIQNNLIMQKAQDSLDRGDIDGAIAIINDFSVQNGQTAELRDAVRELNVLKDIKTLLNNIITEHKSKYQISSSDLSKKPLTPVDLMGIEDLKADIDIAWVSGNKNIDTLMAILEAENPSDSLVSYFRKSMSDDWSSINVQSTYLNTNSEVLVFRTLANNSFDSSNKQLIKKIASFEPNNYRDLLSKAILLNMTNDVEKSNTMLTLMKTQLGISDDVYKSWFTLTLKNNTIDSLNELVTTPFFIYCNQNASMKAQQ